MTDNKLLEIHSRWRGYSPMLVDTTHADSATAECVNRAQEDIDYLLKYITNAGVELAGLMARERDLRERLSLNSEEE